MNQETLNKMSSKVAVDNVLQAFGFVSNEARRNLVVFFIVILIFSNIFFVYQNIVLTNRIQKLNDEKSEIILSLSAQITDEVRRQITPTTTRINQTVNKIDSVAVVVDSVATKTNKILNLKK